MSIWAETQAELDESQSLDQRARDQLTPPHQPYHSPDTALVFATLSVAAALRALARIVDEEEDAA